MRKHIYRYLQNKAFSFLQLKSKLSTGISIEIKNRMEWIIYNDLFVEGDYDLPLMDMLNMPDAIINIVDLGANVGFFDLRIAHLFARHKSQKQITIKAVEGSKELCKELEKRWHRLNNDHIKIQVVHGLVGNRQGIGQLYQFNDHGLNSTVRPAGIPVETQYVNLTELCSSLQEIHLLKCDIEGSELSFVQNYSDLLQKARAIVIEFHPELCNTQQCTQILKENGFTQITLIKDYGNCSVQYFQKEEPS